MRFITGLFTFLLIFSGHSDDSKLNGSHQQKLVVGIFNTALPHQSYYIVVQPDMSMEVAWGIDNSKHFPDASSLYRVFETAERRLTELEFDLIFQNAQNMEDHTPLDDYRVVYGSGARIKVLYNSQIYQMHMGYMDEHAQGMIDQIMELSPIEIRLDPFF